MPAPSIATPIRSFASLALAGREIATEVAGDADWSSEQWDHYTEAPRDPRYAALAEELMDWLQEDYRDDPLGQALTIKSYLEKQSAKLRDKTGCAEVSFRLSREGGQLRLKAKPVRSSR